MRLMFVDQFSELGGGQRCFLALLPAMLERGWSVHGALPGDGPLTRAMESTPIHCGPYGTGAKSVADAVRFAADIVNQRHVLSRLMQQQPFDLIYVNGPRVLPGAALAARGRTPILFHAHNYLDRSYSARIAGLSVHRSVRTVVACSEFVAGPFRPHARQLSVVTNASRDMGFRARSFKAPLWLGVIGRIEAQKGQIDLIQAARQLPGTRVTICGSPGPDSAGYYARALELARGLDIEFVGWRDDISHMLAQLDSVVIPSQQEGLPLVMLEALSAGALVAAYPRGGVPEVITDRETGFLVPECSPEGIAHCIRRLISAPWGDLARVAQNGRRLWEERHTVRQFQQRMLALIEQTAAGTAHPPSSR